MAANNSQSTSQCEQILQAVCLSLFIYQFLGEGNLATFKLL